MWHDSVADALVKIGGAAQLIRRRQIKCFGAGESQIEEMLPDLIRRGRKPTVGITASKTSIILRIAAEGDTEEACYAAMEPTIATIRECLGTLVFGEDDETVLDSPFRKGDRILRLAGRQVAHSWDIAAIEKTIAFPMEPLMQTGDPRVLVAFLLFSLAAVLHILLGRRGARA